MRERQGGRTGHAEGREGGIRRGTKRGHKEGRGGRVRHTEWKAWKAMVSQIRAEVGGA